MIVDDGSPDNQPDDALGGGLTGEGLQAIELTTLRRNLGHQRAIAIGLCRLREVEDCDLIVVMDADGEDKPDDIPRLVQAIVDQEDADVVFAERKRRSENITFRLGYHSYRLLHRLLVGFPIRFGNFSVIRRRALERLVVAQEVWNHYAASVVRLRIPFTLIPTERGERLAGKSTMNTEFLVMHGLSAMSVFSDRIGVRLLIMSALAAIATMAGILAVLVIRLVTMPASPGFATPGWATLSAGFLLVLLIQFVSSSLIFVFVVLLGRQGSGFCPMLDYAPFILNHRTIWAAKETYAPSR
jgi:polyisoprenyl-phosphate glycosyltransferase